jgi:hypothetical protein
MDSAALATELVDGLDNFDEVDCIMPRVNGVSHFVILDIRVAVFKFPACVQVPGVLMVDDSGKNLAKLPTV